MEELELTKKMIAEVQEAQDVVTVMFWIATYALAATTIVRLVFYQNINERLGTLIGAIVLWLFTYAQIGIIPQWYTINNYKWIILIQSIWVLAFTVGACVECAGEDNRDEGIFNLKGSMDDWCESIGRYYTAKKELILKHKKQIS